MQTLSKVTIMKRVKDLSLMAFEKMPVLKGFFFQMRKYVNDLPGLRVEVRTSDIFMIYFTYHHLTYLTILQSFKFVR